MKRVGIIGAGGMGGFHLSRWKLLPVEVIGYYDQRAEQAAARVEQFGGRAFATIDELLQEVDLVDICTPSTAHAGPVVAAAQAGKDIVCEKPIARHLREAEEMIAACEAASVRLFVAQVVRFFPEFVHAKQVLDSGALGTPGVVRTIRSSSFPGHGWYGNFAESGGVILDLAIHDIDYLQWICGPITRVFGRGLSFQNIQGTDHALITLRFASGAIGHVEASWAYPTGNFRTFLEIAGTEGVLHHNSEDVAPLRIRLHEQARADHEAVPVPGSIVAIADDPYYRELKHFVECLESGADFLVAPRDARSALKVALATIESVRTGRPIDIATFEEES